jgi:DNA-binding NarL/FixJ family response regulator
MTILIIDDDVEDRMLFCEAVNELFPKATCRSINSCDNINETIELIQPDLIFMDGHMYPKNGAECLKEIKGVINRERIKIVIHSGNLSPEELHELKTAGADHILIKASSFEALKANIKFIIEEYRLV